jgi:hypothetical protein
MTAHKCNRSIAKIYAQISRVALHSLKPLKGNLSLKDDPTDNHNICSNLHAALRNYCNASGLSLHLI